MNFCPSCAQPLERRVPPGDNRERDVCDACGRIHYRNPRVIVGVVAEWERQLLLVRRAIEPRQGFWTLPAGFLEMGESSEAGARRETREEAGAEVEITGLLAVYDITAIGQVQLFYAARLISPRLDPGIESLDAGLFAWEDIPWEELAFTTVRWALEYHHGLEGRAPTRPDRREAPRDGH